MKKHILIRYYLDEIVIPLSSVEFLIRLVRWQEFIRSIYFATTFPDQQSNAGVGIHMDKRDIYKYFSLNGGINIFS